MRFELLAQWFCLGVLAAGLPGCAAPPVMAVNEPSVDIAHSGKALVITSSLEDTHGLFGHLTPATMNSYINADIRTPGPDGKIRNEFPEFGGVSTYLIEPGHYYLAGVYTPGTKAAYNFDQAHSPAGFAVAAGDVVYLGELHVERSTNTEHPTCGAAVAFTVQDTLATDLPNVEKRLDEKYPGAKALLRTSLMRVYPGVQTMKPAGGCLF